MLLFVPQGFVALVFEDGVLRAVVEAGIGFVPRGVAPQVQFVDLQQQADQEAEAPATLQ
jgi:homogentisate 1,2-dioxygenase